MGPFSRWFRGKKAGAAGTEGGPAAEGGTEAGTDGAGGSGSTGAGTSAADPPRRRRPAARGGPGVALAPITAEVTEAATTLLAQPVDLELALARFADGLRRHALTPEPPSAARALLARAAGDPARVALLGRVIGAAPLGASLPLLGDHPARELTRAAAEALEDKPLLTIELLAESGLRAEELARALLEAAGLAVAGETAEESRERAARINYAHLLAEAERAKREAEERVAALKALAEKRASVPRGKW